MLAVDVREERTVIDLPASSAKGASLASVHVSARGMRGTVANSRGGGNSGRSDREQDAVLVAKPGLLN